MFFSEPSVLKLSGLYTINRRTPSFNTVTLKLMRRPILCPESRRYVRMIASWMGGQTFYGFQFHNDSAFDEEIQSVSTFELHFLVDHRDAQLSFYF